ncbi:MAG: CIA30 family protein [Acidobacteriota bacterium]
MKSLPLAVMLLLSTPSLAEPSVTFTSLLEFDDVSDLRGWRSIDDRVMGGVSRSTLELSDDGFVRFSGILSLEQNGGFASVRSSPARWGLAGEAGLVLRVRGDGRIYKLSIRIDGRFDGVNYQVSFATEPGRWLDVHLPFSAFQPTYHGRLLRDVPPLNPADIRQVGFLVSDKQEGFFQLDIDHVHSWR